MNQPDLLVFMSDQHSPNVSSFVGGPAQTPNLEKLSADGVAFTSTYTACPICVPARTSMLLGRLPSKTGVFTNGAIPESSATFLHSLVAVGYETVLIGRMHFFGTNQRHGFTKRLVGDVTPVSWNYPREEVAARNGELNGTFSEPGAISVIGGGNSPVLEFDRQVVQAAIDYLAEPHDKPQCVFVSTYGPHFPYVAPPELYCKYKELVDVPETFSRPPDVLNPLLKNRVIDVDPETVVRARAAYFAMIETIDSQVGEVRAAFDRYLARQGHKGVFAYFSDHGDQAGEHGLFGKMTFFEGSARIPLIVAGDGVAKAKRIQTPTSILDIGPTLCALAGTVPPPRQDGISLLPALTGEELPPDRMVITELIDDVIGNKAIVIGPEHPVPARMIRWRQFKFITYTGYEDYDLLFDVENDPEETINLIAQWPALAEKLRQAALVEWDPEELVQNHLVGHTNFELVKAWERAVGPDLSEFWRNLPDDARKKPVVS
ncbi:MAG: sulfatase-like hydrolase/transferase [Saccharofermentanales bacterium]